MSGVYYGDYLQLDRILNAQVRESEARGAPAHDEMLFIITHQTYELWFKQVIFELEAVHSIFSAPKVTGRAVSKAVSHLGRVVKIQELLLQQIGIIETMQPLDFLDFRNMVVPASGFQSTQFRLLEGMLGLRPAQRKNPEGVDYKAVLSESDREQVEQHQERKSLAQLIEAWLERIPFLKFEDFAFWSAYQDAVNVMLNSDQQIIENHSYMSPEQKSAELKKLEGTRAQFGGLFDAKAYAAQRAEGKRDLSYEAFQAALFINLYRDEPILALPFRVLTLLMDVDENMSHWRHRHAQMALRMIGSKIGTGGSSGHEYLASTIAHHRVLKDLFNLSSYYIPRSSLPPLPENLQRALGFDAED